MHIKLPSVETLRAEKCPAPIALMMHQMYAMIPDAQLNADGGRKQEHVDYFNALAEKIGNVRSLEDFKPVSEFLLRGTGLFKDDVPIEEQFDPKSLSQAEFFIKYRDVGDLLGLEFPAWGDDDFVKSKWINARVATGEDRNKVIAELMKEDEAKELKEGKKQRAQTAEEIKDQEELERVMKLTLHDTPEGWHTVKRYSRLLAKEQEGGENEDWAAFQKEEAAFVERFGLKGVRFPYHMGLPARIKGLADITDNFCKITQALEMPDHYIGFKKRMPVYYGGAVSGSLGTYTYVTHTLFVLKDMGDRATAHEWFHALDYDMAFQTGNRSQSNLGGALSFSEPNLISVTKDMRPLKDAMVSLMEGVKYGFNGGEPISSEKFISPKGGVFWDLVQNVYAKELLTWVPEENRATAIQRFNYACKSLHTKEFKPQDFARYVSNEYDNALALTQPETRKMLLTSFKDEMEILAGLYLVLTDETDALKKEKTSFMMWFAERLDYKAGRQYYTIPTELIARMGEQYVFDKIGEPLKEHITPQYALAFEKSQIMERFGAWVNEAITFLEYDSKPAAENQQKVSSGMSIK